jgi:hypothetical protein
VDNRGTFPIGPEAFMSSVIEGKYEYIAQKAFPKTPWGGYQKVILDAKACGLAVPPQEPTSEGTVLGPGCNSKQIKRITDFGAIAYAADSNNNEHYVLYAIGSKGGKAIITKFAKNY